MKYFISYIWAIVWAIIMIILLLIPSNELPDVDELELFPGFDKVVHMGIFFILAVLLYWEAAMKSQWKRNKWNTVLKVVLSTVIFAFLTEEAQRLVSSRSTDIIDFFADCIGIGMATFAFLLIYKRPKEV